MLDAKEVNLLSESNDSLSCSIKMSYRELNWVIFVFCLIPSICYFWNVACKLVVNHRNHFIFQAIVSVSRTMMVLRWAHNTNLNSVNLIQVLIVPVSSDIFHRKVPFNLVWRQLNIKINGSFNDLFYVQVAETNCGFFIYNKNILSCDFIFRMKTIHYFDLVGFVTTFQKKTKK